MAEIQQKEGSIHQNYFSAKGGAATACPASGGAATLVRLLAVRPRHSNSWSRGGPARLSDALVGPANRGSGSGQQVAGGGFSDSQGEPHNRGHHGNCLSESDEISPSALMLDLSQHLQHLRSQARKYAQSELLLVEPGTSRRKILALERALVIINLCEAHCQNNRVTPFVWLRIRRLFRPGWQSAEGGRALRDVQRHCVDRQDKG